MLLGSFITGWDVRSWRNALQHSYNAWVRVFGTGNKDHRQIIDQAKAFFSAYSMSRFAPLPYDEWDLAGYRDRDEHSERPILSNVLPTPFKEQIANPFTAEVVALALYDAGMLKKSSESNR